MVNWLPHFSDPDFTMRITDMKSLGNLDGGAFSLIRMVALPVRSEWWRFRSDANDGGRQSSSNVAFSVRSEWWDFQSDPKVEFLIRIEWWPFQLDLDAGVFFWFTLGCPIFIYFNCSLCSESKSYFRWMFALICEYSYKDIRFDSI